MSKADWAALYISVPLGLKKRIEAAAAADDRSVAKWIERTLTDHFDREDSLCDPICSCPDSSPVSSE